MHLPSTLLTPLFNMNSTIITLNSCTYPQLYQHSLLNINSTTITLNSSTYPQLFVTLSITLTSTIVTLNSLHLFTTLALTLNSTQLYQLPSTLPTPLFKMNSTIITLDSCTYPQLYQLYYST